MVLKSLNKTRSIGFETQEDLTGHVVQSLPMNMIFNYEKGYLSSGVQKIKIVVQ